MSNLTLAQVARRFGIGRNSLISQLKHIGLINAQRLPSQHDIDKGRFVIEQRLHHGNQDWNNGNGQMYHMALVTPAGMPWLAKQLGLTIRDMSQPKAAQAPDVAKAVGTAQEAIRMLRMHLDRPGSIPRTSALEVAEDALQLLEQLKRSAA